MHRHLVLSLALLSWGLAPATAAAASVLYVTEVEQARLSDAVVLGTVTSQRVERSAQLGRPVTLSEVRVEEVLYGTAPATLTLTQLHGTIEGRTVALPGDADLKTDERVVLFLRRQDGAWMTTALEQSKYTVQAGRFGLVLTRGALHSELYLRDGRGGLRAVAEPVTKPVRPLATLRATLQELR